MAISEYILSKPLR